LSNHPLLCYDKAVELLGQRPHFRRQLAVKLARRGFAEAEIEQALDRLAEQGYLDDTEAARGYAAARRAREGEGRVRIEAELRRRGAAAAAVTAALADLPADEVPAAREAAARWMRLHGGRASGAPGAAGSAAGASGAIGAAGDLAALARHLARKGFPAHVIVAVLNEQPGGAAAAAALAGDEP
jgi:SOS response regulatory protein OraA/RecX